MRRRRGFRVADVPRVIVGGVVAFAGLFGGRYRRIEGAHVLAIDDEGRILVVRTTYLGPGWMLPGGRVEHDETPHEAAARETREETGIEVTVDRLLMVDARKGRDVSFIFAGRAAGGTLEPQAGEIAEAGWLDRDEIAASSPRLHRLLGLIDDGVVYRGLAEAPSRPGKPRIGA